MSKHNDKKISKGDVKLVVVDTFDAFMSLEESWNSLYEKSTRSTIFSSWDWMITWWETFKDQFHRELLILCLYQDNELVGIAPFQIDINYPKSFIQGKTLRFIGAGEADEDDVTTENLDFIVLPEMEEEMVANVSDYLAVNKSKWNFADFEYLLKNALILKCFIENTQGISVQKIKYGVRFFIPEHENMEQYLSSMSSRRRKRFRKKMRTISHFEDCEFATLSDKSIDNSLATLANLHGLRWRDKLGSSIFDSTRFYEFHQKILKRLVPQNKAWIKALVLDGEAQSCYYAFVDKGRVYYYQSGFSPKYANSVSPLYLLILNEVGNALENNQHFDFMYTDSADSYKKNQYATDFEDMYRLKWTPQPFRFQLFKFSKMIKTKSKK